MKYQMLNSKGVMYNAWTFNGLAPGPVLRVKEEDTLHLSLKNMDPAVPHSIDVHAVHTAPSNVIILTFLESDQVRKNTHT